MDGATTSAKALMAVELRKLLAIADAFGWLDVGVQLDAALVALTGVGVPPPED